MPSSPTADIINERTTPVTAARARTPDRVGTTETGARPETASTDGPSTQNGATSHRSGSRESSADDEEGEISDAVPVLNDTTASRLFAIKYHPVIRFHIQRANWFAYDHRAGIWREGEAAASRYLQEFVTANAETARKEHEEAERQHAQSPRDHELKAGADKKKAVRAFWTNAGNASRINGVLHLAKSNSLLEDRDTKWNHDPNLFALPDGLVYDLTKGEARASTPDDFLTMQGRVTYDPDAECPRFDRFLKEVYPNPHIRAYITRYFGYAITGHTREQLVMCMWGGGGNGKGTEADVLANILGENEYLLTLPISTLQRKMSGNIPNDVAQLADKRVAFTRETDDTKPLDVALLKQLSGEDTIAARFMRGEWFRFRAIAKVFMFLNDKPPIKDTTHAAWRRFKVIPHEARFEQGKDKTLKDDLIAELPGIQNRLFEWAQDYIREGLWPEPDEVTFATQEYRNENSPVRQWFDGNCTLDPTATVTRRTAYDHFKKWCEAEGIDQNDVPKPQTFSKDLKNVDGVEDGGGASGNRRWQGFALNEAVSEAVIMGVAESEAAA